MLPSINLPTKSHAAAIARERRTIIKHASITDNCLVENNASSNGCFNLYATISRTHSLNVPDSWKILVNSESEIRMIIPSSDNFVDSVKLILPADLNYHVALYGIPVPHESLPSTEWATYDYFSKFLSILGKFQLCAGYEKVLKPQNWIPIHLFETTCNSLNGSKVR